MKVKSLKKRRYEHLLQRGFMAWEAKALSKNTIGSTGMQELIKDRLQRTGVWAYRNKLITRERAVTHAEAEGLWTLPKKLQDSYREFIYNTYLYHGWYVLDEAKSKKYPYGFNPFARLREIVDSIRQLPGGEFESPRGKVSARTIDYYAVLEQTRTARGVA